MTRLFGTDGVRGIANEELTPTLAFELGLAAARVLTEETHHKPTFVVGTDTRISCGMLGSALIAGITSAGADVIHVGVIATPGVAWLTRRLKADAGAMISASHNSYEFNGIKLFSGGGFKLPDETEDAIEAVIRQGFHGNVRPVGENVGRLSSYEGGGDRYRDHLLEIADLDLTGMHLVIDCANGASYRTAPALFEALGARVTALGVDPDGFNINRDCGSTYAHLLGPQVVEAGADLGLAFDGDADRLIAVDDRGQIVDGDVMMAILARDLDRRGQLKQKTIVATVMSNFGLGKMAREAGYFLVRTPVGDRYVLEHMLDNDLALGGEQSGHVILLDDTTTGDGQLTALRLLRALRSSGRPLSEERQIIELFPQVLESVRVKETNKNRIMENPDFLQAIEEVEQELASEGGVLVRKSGTEPVIRIMIEGSDLEKIRGLAGRLAGRVKSLDASLGQG